ncbi:MAG: hypothetical protein ACREV7_18415 [Steroidobacteraceae bacterium]
MSKKGVPSLLERHWAESALAIGAVVIAAAANAGSMDRRAPTRRA